MKNRFHKINFFFFLHHQYLFLILFLQYQLSSLRIKLFGIQIGFSMPRLKIDSFIRSFSSYISFSLKLYSIIKLQCVPISMRTSPLYSFVPRKSQNAKLLFPASQNFPTGLSTRTVYTQLNFNLYSNSIPLETLITCSITRKHRFTFDGESRGVVATRLDLFPIRVYFALLQRRCHF